MLLAELGESSQVKSSKQAGIGTVSAVGFVTKPAGASVG